MIEGSGSVYLTNGSGSGGPKNPKNMWILRIRIRNTASNINLKGLTHEMDLPFGDTQMISCRPR
jgi:hypothetical protein